MRTFLLFSAFKKMWFSNIFMGSVVFVSNLRMKGIFSDAHANIVKQKLPFCNSLRLKIHHSCFLLEGCV